MNAFEKAIFNTTFFSLLQTFLSFLEMLILQQLSLSKRKKTCKLL